tara:strand:- start:272 stop:718 length:447 start_codon:yes stop_codon:yes gene_type:complete
MEKVYEQDEDEKKWMEEPEANEKERQKRESLMKQQKEDNLEKSKNDGGPSVEASPHVTFQKDPGQSFQAELLDDGGASESEGEELRGRRSGSVPATPRRMNTEERLVEEGLGPRKLTLDERKSPSGPLIVVDPSRLGDGSVSVRISNL